ncbi:hypothetical protein [Cereibacter ovatus]|uniref:hypothetical protein n=1 Tax=Cereibacter ovatus TaxID=439529 RepID=UPI00195DEDA5|nr:hypothetical protein [Cereibacter ovatus]
MQRLGKAEDRELSRQEQVRKQELPDPYRPSPTILGDFLAAYRNKSRYALKRLQIISLCGDAMVRVVADSGAIRGIFGARGVADAPLRCLIAPFPARRHDKAGVVSRLRSGQTLRPGPILVARPCNPGLSGWPAGGMVKKALQGR